jgi:antirestriction protein
MRVYIEDLSCYNQGYSCVVGKWINLPCDNLQEVIKGILDEGTKLCKDSIKHEEYSIHDYEDCIGKVTEYSNVFELNHIAQRMEELSEEDNLKVQFLLDNSLVCDLDEAIENIDNVIIHSECSMIDIAEQYIDECVDLSNVADIVKFNINYEGIARDIEIEGNYFKIDNDIYEYLN